MTDRPATASKLARMLNGGKDKVAVLQLAEVRELMAYIVRLEESDTALQALATLAHQARAKHKD